tara:strand:+ start:550 stop:750 length:201 start_codon:yes stop_codon:yes gene_type:complete
MIKVFFESKYHAEEVATFKDEDVYMTCLPLLRKLAKKDRMKVTESVEEHNEISYDSDYYLIPSITF